MEDVDVGTLAQLCCHLLFSGSLVADQTDDQVLRVFGDGLEEPVLGQISQRPWANKAGRLTPIPLDTPVITYTDMLSDSKLKWVASWCKYDGVECDN